MAPTTTQPLAKRVLGSVKPTRAASLIIEAWSQGFMVGALVIMGAVTVSNMREGVILHKLILLEVNLCQHLSLKACTDAPTL